MKVFFFLSEHSAGLRVINMLEYSVHPEVTDFPWMSVQTVYQSLRGPSDWQRTGEVFREPVLRRGQQPRNVKQTQPAVK